MNTEIFSKIAHILEKDSKSTTYKFALLRGVIEIAQESTPYAAYKEDRVHLPTGLLVYKFILYYYPIFKGDRVIPQIAVNKKLNFQNSLCEFINYYQEIGGLTAFNKELRGRGIDEKSNDLFQALLNAVYFTVTDKPMRHIGYSINEYEYSIFKIERKKERHINIDRFNLKAIIEAYGTFSIPTDYFDVFKFLGSFILGRESIMLKWAEFSVKASKKNFSKSQVLSQMLIEPNRKRLTQEALKYYKKQMVRNGQLYCIWSGKAMIKSYHIDHVIPYSIWGNNDLWNLLPAKGEVNGAKRDKIPTPKLINSQKELIVECWEGLNLEFEGRFQQELKVSLIGNEPKDYWQDKAIEKLQASCRYLIEQRGFQEWNG